MKKIPFDHHISVPKQLSEFALCSHVTHKSYLNSINISVYSGHLVMLILAPPPSLSNKLSYTEFEYLFSVILFFEHDLQGTPFQNI